MISLNIEFIGCAIVTLLFCYLLLRVIADALQIEYDHESKCWRR